MPREGGRFLLTACQLKEEIIGISESECPEEGGLEELHLCLVVVVDVDSPVGVTDHEEVLDHETVPGAEVHAVHVLGTSLPAGCGGEADLVSDVLVKHQHGVTIKHLIGL